LRRPRRLRGVELPVALFDAASALPLFLPPRVIAENRGELKMWRPRELIDRRDQLSGQPY
jgi:hypothetical protein